MPTVTVALRDSRPCVHQNDTRSMIQHQEPAVGGGGSQMGLDRTPTMSPAANANVITILLRSFGPLSLSSPPPLPPPPPSLRVTRRKTNRS